MNNEALSILVKITGQLGPWYQVLSMAGTLVGFCLIVFSLVALASQKQGMMRSFEFKKPIAGIAVGIILINLFPFLNVIAGSTFGGESANALSYAGSAGNGIQSAMIKFAVYVTKMVGLWGVITGLYGLYNSSQDARSFWPSVAHVFGGFAAMNVLTLFRIVGSTLGGTAQTTINSLIS